VEDCSERECVQENVENVQDISKNLDHDNRDFTSRSRPVEFQSDVSPIIFYAAKETI